MKAGIRVTFLRAKEHQRWPANPRKPGEKLGQILLTVLEGSCPADTVGYRSLRGPASQGNVMMDPGGCVRRAKAAARMPPGDLALGCTVLSSWPRGRLHVPVRAGGARNNSLSADKNRRGRADGAITQDRRSAHFSSK